MGVRKLAYLVEWTERLGLVGRLQWSMDKRMTVGGKAVVGTRSCEELRSRPEGCVGVICMDIHHPMVVILARQGKRWCHSK